MKMTLEEAQDNLSDCRSKLQDLQRQVQAVQQKAIFLQGYIQALAEEDEGAEESAPAPPSLLKAV